MANLAGGTVATPSVKCFAVLTPRHFFMDLILEFFETFKENYPPADDFSSATDFMSTDEICDIIESNGVFFTDRDELYRKLIEAGYKLDLIPSSPPAYKWLIKKS